MCNCRRCQDERAENDLAAAFVRTMSLCPMCGDKRCPRAQDHRNFCGAMTNETDDPIKNLVLAAVDAEAQAEELFGDIIRKHEDAERRERRGDNSR